MRRSCAASENIIFSSKGKVIHHPGLLRANKVAPRFIVLTERVCILLGHEMAGMIE